MPPQQEHSIGLADNCARCDGSLSKEVVIQMAAVRKLHVGEMYAQPWVFVSDPLVANHPYHEVRSLRP